MIYFLLAGITCYFALSAKEAPIEHRLKPKKKFNITAYGLLLTLMFIIIAFRASTIGVDTQNYINKFFQIKKYFNIFDYYKRYEIEPLYYFINRVLGWFDDTGISILIFQAVVVVWGYNTCFSKFGVNRYVCLLAFLSLGLFAAVINLLRQTIAMAICAYNLTNAVEGNLKKFIFFSIIASLIHFSALFFIPAYFVCRCLKSNRKNAVLIIGISILMAFAVERLQSVISTIFGRWEHYSDVETGAQGYIAFTIFFLITLLAFCFQNEIKEEGKYASAILNLNYVHMGIWVLRLFTRNAERVAFYYTIAPVLLIPLLFKAIEKRFSKNTALIFKILVITCLAAYFIYKTVRDGSYYPYAFWGN